MAELTVGPLSAQQVATAKTAFGWLINEDKSNATTEQIEAWMLDQGKGVVKRYRAWQRSTQAAIDAAEDVDGEGW